MVSNSTQVHKDVLSAPTCANNCRAKSAMIYNLVHASVFFSSNSGLWEAGAYLGGRIHPGQVAKLLRGYNLNS